MAILDEEHRAAERAAELEGRKRDVARVEAAAEAVREEEQQKEAYRREQAVQDAVSDPLAHVPASPLPPLPPLLSAPSTLNPTLPPSPEPTCDDIPCTGGPLTVDSTGDGPEHGGAIDIFGKPILVGLTPTDKEAKAKRFFASDILKKLKNHIRRNTG